VHLCEQKGDEVAMPKAFSSFIMPGKFLLACIWHHVLKFKPWQGHVALSFVYVYVRSLENVGM
jgi:hypothetical protein